MLFQLKRIVSVSTLYFILILLKRFFSFASFSDDLMNNFYPPIKTIFSKDKLYKTRKQNILKI